VHDEVLSHRLGLVPLRVDPRQFEWFTENETVATDRNTVVFDMAVKVPAVRGSGPAAAAAALATTTVYSRDLRWKPQGHQAQRFGGPAALGPVHDDIILAKLRPGQEVLLEAHARLGVGKDHAKFSPTATTAYRQLPLVALTKPVTGARAAALAKTCPMKVFDVEDLGGGAPGAASVARPRSCTFCGECERNGFDEVATSRKAEHYIFSVESTGQVSAPDILLSAVEVLRGKCATLLAILDGPADPDGDGDGGGGGGGDGDVDMDQ